MIFNYSNYELDELARIMRSEALSDGELAMLMVGNVVANRVLANCLTFKNVNNIHDVINQPNQFVGKDNSLYYAKATTREKELASRVLKGEFYYPATNALWFYAPAKNTDCKNNWFNNDYAGRYKTHCFYNPNLEICQLTH